MNSPIKDLFALAEEAIAPVIWPEKKALKKFKESATPERVREVAEAFLALEQRAEAAEASLNAVRLQRDVNRELRKEAEAKLKDLEKQQPVAYIMGDETIDDFNRGYEFFAVRDAEHEEEMKSIPLFTRPAPAASPVELVPFEKAVCDFVTEHYSKYQGSYLCGKCAEIVSYLLSMNGVRCEKMTCKINGVGHVLVKSGDYFIDPSIKQFGNYPEFSVGRYPIKGVELFCAVIMRKAQEAQTK